VSRMRISPTIKSLHQRFPWVPPLFVLMAAIASVAFWKTALKPPVHEATIKNDLLVDSLLHPHGDITPEVFACPTTQPEKWDFGGAANTALNWSNWNTTPSSQRTLSYSYQNPFEKSPRPTTGKVQSGK
jgi:hypothetical protein